MKNVTHNVGRGRNQCRFRMSGAIPGFVEVCCCGKVQTLWPGSEKPAAQARLFYGMKKMYSGAPVKIILSALFLAIAWTVALAIIARTYGLHSEPGIWAGVFGLPGVVIANWTQSNILHEFNTTLGYGIMFLVNWIFYCSVIQGLISVKRSIWNS